MLPPPTFPNSYLQAVRVHSISVGLCLFPTPIFMHGASRIVYKFHACMLASHECVCVMHVFVSSGYGLGVIKEVESQPKCVNQFDYSAI